MPARTEIPLPAIRHGYTAWSDIAMQEGWRVQHHVGDGCCRLVNPRGLVIAKGPRNEIIKDWRRYAVAGSVAVDRVLLLHGLSRTGRIYRRISRSLTAAGFEVIAPSYPSLRQSLDDHARDMRSVLDHLSHTGNISLVGHSLGGLIVHRLIDEPGAWKDRLDLRAAVLITVPHNGSRLGARVARHPLAARLLGPSLQDCLPGRQRLARTDGLPILNILGLTGYRTGFNPGFGRDNDLVLAEDEMHLATATHQARVPRPHGLIYRAGSTVSLITRFLQGAHAPHHREGEAP
ncbi:MAG: alpha/beta fold hydrolase [Geminicoccaceae bacterium]|nr:alpha/beta fold hydrolase [Geminicoccaceae bacterium]